MAAAGNDHASNGDEGGQADRAYAAVLHAIATCELLPGAVLNERQHAAELGMSRTPFREALHRLAADGLVTTNWNRKVRVSLLDADTIEGHFVVREVLEIELLRTVIEERREVDLRRLERLVEQMDGAIAKGDHRAYLRFDEEFHVLICEAAGNRPAIEAVKRAWTHVNRLRYLGPGDTTNLRGSLAEHRRLLNALRRHDASRAENTVRAHMKRARGLLRDLVEDLPSVFVAADEVSEAAATSQG